MTTSYNPAIRTEIGKIQSATFGFGGYQDVQFGAAFKLGGQSWGVHDFWGHWGIVRGERSEWTEEQRCYAIGEAAMKVAALLRSANKNTIDELVNVPIEATFDGMTLKSWRILTEVL